MNTRVVSTFLSVSLGLSTATPAQVDSCTPKPKCARYVGDRLELELAMQLNPDVARQPAASVGDRNIRDLLEKRDKYHAKSLEPSVSNLRAQQLQMLQYYTLRLPAPVPRTPQELRAISADFLSLGPTVVKRAAPVPSARPPTDDPFIGSGSVVKYPKTAPCGTQWYLYATGVDAAWQRCGATGTNVVVADIDWGFDLSHEELQGAWSANHTYDMCNGNSAAGFAYHGTGVAGLIAARKDETGMRGIAYDATIWPITASCATDVYRPCDASWGQGNPWADAISKVMSESCDGCRKVVLLENQTCCEGNYEGSVAVNGWIQKAIESNIVVVVAAGNGCKDAGLDDNGNPIDETGSIVVGATDYGAKHFLLDGSNFGSRILVSAPGPEDIDVTITNDHYPCQVGGVGPLYTKMFGGTSGAAAKVAGVVALMLHKNNTLSPARVKEILKSSGEPVTNIDATKTGGVFLDAFKAVAAAMAPEVCLP